MSIDTTELHEFKEEKNNRTKLTSYNSGQKWCFRKIFATQLSFDMFCTVKALKVESKN